jgi:cytochrome c-type biogenesis protein CcmH
MIETMVAGLADKLKAAPDDADGWMRLIRSYVVLGRTADATNALGEARTALAAEPDKLQPIEDMAKQLGVAEVTQ